MKVKVCCQLLDFPGKAETFYGGIFDLEIEEITPQDKRNVLRMLKTGATALNNPGLAVYQLVAKTGNPLQFFGFRSTVKEGALLYLATMNIPGFFKGIEADSDICGLFLLSIGDRGDKYNLHIDTKVGQYGCPQRIVMDAATKSGTHAFEFNQMRFYPFLSTEMQVGYYVCDAESERHDWQRKYKDFHERFSVGLNFPLQYDATLGLQLTRSADLYKDEPENDQKP